MTTTIAEAFKEQLQVARNLGVALAKFEMAVRDETLAGTTYHPSDPESVAAYEAAYAAKKAANDVLHAAINATVDAAITSALVHRGIEK